MIILSPKSDFLSDAKKAGELMDITMSPLFKEAAKAALLQYSLRLSKKNTEGPTLAVVGLRMQGAQEVLEELMNLGRPSLPSMEEDDGQLDSV